MPDEVLHSLLTGVELHESLGVAGAAAGSRYLADGEGSGSWEKRLRSYIAMHSYAVLDHSPSASNPNRGQFIVPFDCTIERVILMFPQPMPNDHFIDLQSGNSDVAGMRWTRLEGEGLYDDNGNMVGPWTWDLDTSTAGTFSSGEYLRFENNNDVITLYPGVAQFHLTEVS